LSALLRVIDRPSSCLINTAAWSATPSTPLAPTHRADSVRDYGHCSCRPVRTQKHASFRRLFRRLNWRRFRRQTCVIAGDSTVYGTAMAAVRRRERRIIRGLYDRCGRRFKFHPVIIITALPCTRHVIRRSCLAHAAQNSNLIYDDLPRVQIECRLHTTQFCPILQ